MSLFDDNFMIALEAKAKEAEAAEDDAKEDKDAEPAEGEGKGEEAPAEDKAEGKEAETECKEGEDAKDPEPAEGKEEEPAEGEEAPAEDEEAEEAALTVEEMASVEVAVDADIEADTLTEAVGFDSLISSDVEDAHFACLESVTAITAFDQADLACTEAYVAAGSQFEKDLVTESFKESAKKFGMRVKAFVLKIKQAIARIFNKAVNYLKVLSSRVVAKFASGIKLDGSKEAPVNAKVKVYDVLDDDFGKVKQKVEEACSNDVLNIINKINGGNVAELKTQLAAIKAPSKSDIVKRILGEAKEKDLRGNYDKAKGPALLADLKTINKNVEIIKKWRGLADGLLKTYETKVRSAKDINTDELNLLNACISKVVSTFNTKVSAMFSLQSAWINHRVRIIRALAKYQGEEAPEAPKTEAKTESAVNFMADFFEMVN